MVESFVAVCKLKDFLLVFGLGEVPLLTTFKPLGLVGEMGLAKGEGGLTLERELRL